MTKSRPLRSRLTWDEILEIEKRYKDNPDVLKLIRHARFLEHLLELAKYIPKIK